MPRVKLNFELLMRKVCFLFLFFCFYFNVPADAQDSTVVLSAEMFQSHQRIFLAPTEGWLFKEGNDPSWANRDIDLNDWKKLKPVDLVTGMEDPQGRLEGWFRINLKVDSSLKDIALAISRTLWMATDIYINGKHFHSFGSTGNPWEAYNPTLQYATPVNLTAGKEYLIAMHLVNYESLFTQRELRLKPQNLKNLIAIAGPEYDDYVKARITNTYLLASMSISLATLFFLLFLLLLLLNPGETIFRLTVLLTLSVLISTWSVFYSSLYTVSFDTEKLLFIVANGFSLPVMHALTLLITEWVLRRRISAISIAIIIFMPITSFMGHVFNISWPFGIVEISLLLYFFYLVAVSWRTNRKAEWVVVLAMTVLTLGSLFWVSMHKYYLEKFEEYENLVKSVVLLSAPTLLLIYVAMSYQKILKQKQEAGKKLLQISREKELLLEEQNEKLELQVAQRTTALEKSLAELKSAQAQLIQSEKMASLGQLTSGIAHEIQNPLNFVNNFSEVSAEMIDEAAGSRQRAAENSPEVTELLNEIKKNLEKISHHGKRADAIVKSMMLHSRPGSDRKETTDLNAFADKYLRLVYHGLREKDNTLHVDIHTDYDPSIGEIEIIQEDISRVLLNVLSNAFYACAERSRSERNRNAADDEQEQKTMGRRDAMHGVSHTEIYQPAVFLSTKKSGEKIYITVKDNGAGISEKIIDRIFQPFFTTKPTGQGTGLGLSICYDIIKAHGGEIKVNSTEGEGSEFIITLSAIGRIE